jgi:hypothetical protein
LRSSYGEEGMYSLAVYETVRISYHPAVMYVERPSDDYCHLVDTLSVAEMKYEYVGVRVYSIIGRHVVSFVGEKYTYRGRLTITSLFHVTRVC